MTHEVEKKIILEEFKTLDDIFVFYKVKYQDFDRDSTVCVVLNPRLLWDLFFDDELDGNFYVLPAVNCSHYKTISTRAKLIAKEVILNKDLEESVTFWKSRGVVTTAERYWVDRGKRHNR